VKDLGQNNWITTGWVTVKEEEHFREEIERQVGTIVSRSLKRQNKFGFYLNKKLLEGFMKEKSCLYFKMITLAAVWDMDYR
jgi:hypothetical protein